MHLSYPLRKHVFTTESLRSQRTSLLAHSSEVRGHGSRGDW